MHISTYKNLKLPRKMIHFSIGYRLLNRHIDSNCLKVDPNHQLMSPKVKHELGGNLKV